MLSNDENITTIAALIEQLRGYLELKKDVIKLDVIEKIVRLVTALTVAVVILILTVIVLFYLSFAFIYWIEPVTGTALAFLIVSLFFLVLLIAVYSLRTRLIERPLVRFLSSTLLN